MEFSTQNLIIALLGVALIVLILKNYDTEIIIAIVSGLIGYLTNNKVDMDKLNSNISQTIDDTLNVSGVSEGSIEDS